jgi:VWFA-related protein
MRFFGALSCVGLLFLQSLNAQAPPTPSDTPTFRVTSRLVFLDLTVLDRKGRPVVTGLTRNDFTITESKKPQPIFSFDAPNAHADANAADENPSGEAPLTVFVLDLLNSRFDDFAYIRNQVRKFLFAQPERLASRAELMVLGNRSLELLQAYTRNKEDLLFSLDHLPSALPYKLNAAFIGERFGQSIDALQQIALQNKGIPGRKNIVWVGHGGPALFTTFLPGSVAHELSQYIHDTTNMLVDARLTLFVIYPGLRVNGGTTFSLSASSAGTAIGDDDPFAGDINFGVFVNETGGNLFYNRNDVANEIKRSQQLGSEYYTLTYQPPVGDADGKFRRVRVTVRDPNLRVLTKAGYFAPENRAAVHPRKRRIDNIVEAVRATIPFPALPLTIENVVRHPDSGRVEFTVVLQSGELAWQPADSGKSTADLTMAGASLTNHREILASKLETLTLSAETQNATQLAALITRLPMRLRMPPKTEEVRVVIQTPDGGRTGSVELTGKTIAAAPEAPTPEPKLRSRGPALTTP